MQPLRQKLANIIHAVELSNFSHPVTATQDKTPTSRIFLSMNYLYKGWRICIWNMKYVYIYVYVYVYVYYVYVYVYEEYKIQTIKFITYKIIYAWHWKK